jgi:hypothetical protein
MRRMTDNSWYVATHGDRVVLTLPGEEGSEGFVFDMSATDASEMAAALTEAAEAVDSA